MNQIERLKAENEAHTRKVIEDKLKQFYKCPYCKWPFNYVVSWKLFNEPDKMEVCYCCHRNCNNFEYAGKGTIIKKSEILSKEETKKVCQKNQLTII